MAFHQRRTRLLISGLAGLALAALALAASNTGVLARYDRLAVDSLFPIGPLDERIIVVGIDERSVERMGGWPWSRAVQAQLLDGLADAGADVVVYDLLLAPPLDGDEELVAVADRLGPDRLVLAGLPRALNTDEAGLLVAEVTLAPDAALLARASIAHSLVGTPHHDGVIRTLPLVVDAGDGTMLPALALGAVLRDREIDETLVLRPNGVQAGSDMVPTGRGWSMVISWPEGLDEAGPHLVSAVDVLDGQVGDLSDRIVLVGITDATVGDRHQTPVAGIGGTPGVLVHAAAINTMLTSAWVKPQSSTAQAAWLGVLALVPALALQVGRLRVGFAAAVALAVLYPVVVVLRFADGVVLEVVWPSLCLLGGLTIGLAVRYFGEARQRQKIDRLFSRYVPESVARALMDTRKLAAVTAGQHRDATVLFCDLRGFTPIAAGLTPGRVRTLLDAFYRRTCTTIIEHGGTVLQYVGDEVFAVFGVPLPDDNHAGHALACAQAIQGNEPDLADELAAVGLPSVRYGIGLHSGTVLAAHMGDRHLQYSVMGDTVNVGSRLCDEALAGEITYSEEVHRRVKTIPGARTCGPVGLKGIEQGVVIWRIPPVTQRTAG